MRSTMTVGVAVFAWLLSSTAASAPRAFDLGRIPFGKPPYDVKTFVSTTCLSNGAYPFADCGATDAEGRKYSFDIDLIRVEATQGVVSDKLALPADLRFGMRIEDAAEAFEATTGIKPECIRADDGARTCVTGFVVPSSQGSMTSVALIADHGGLLAQVVQRVNWP